MDSLLTDLANSVKKGKMNNNKNDGKKDSEGIYNNLFAINCKKKFGRHKKNCKCGDLSIHDRFSYDNIVKGVVNNVFVQIMKCGNYLLGNKEKSRFINISPIISVGRADLLTIFNSSIRDLFKRKVSRRYKEHDLNNVNLLNNIESAKSKDKSILKNFLDMSFAYFYKYIYVAAINELGKVNFPSKDTLLMHYIHNKYKLNDDQSNVLFEYLRDIMCYTYNIEPRKRSKLKKTNTKNRTINLIEANDNIFSNNNINNKKDNISDIKNVKDINNNIKYIEKIDDIDDINNYDINDVDKNVNKVNDIKKIDKSININDDINKASDIDKIDKRININDDINEVNDINKIDKSVNNINDINLEEKNNFINTDKKQINTLKPYKTVIFNYYKSDNGNVSSNITKNPVNCNMCLENLFVKDIFSKSDDSANDFKFFDDEEKRKITNLVKNLATEVGIIKNDK